MELVSKLPTAALLLTRSGFIAIRGNPKTENLFFMYMNVMMIFSICVAPPPLKGTNIIPDT